MPRVFTLCIVVLFFSLFMIAKKIISRYHDMCSKGCMTYRILFFNCIRACAQFTSFIHAQNLKTLQTISIKE